MRIGKKILKFRRSELFRIKGFSVIEIIVSAGILSMYIASLVGALLYFNSWDVRAGDKSRAIFLAGQGIEAVRNIRDNDFADLVDGVYGLDKTSGEWRLNGSFDEIDKFRREITISGPEADVKEIISKVSWQENEGEQAEELNYYLTNWREAAEFSDCTSYCAGLEGFDEGACRQNEQQCLINEETYKQEGDNYCLEGPEADACCCLASVGEVTTCEDYCLGEDYASGSCRANDKQCDKNGEIWRNEGDGYCAGVGGSNACCCGF